jgi:hypothetical protein
MSLFYPSDQYQQSKQLIYSSISNFVIDLANIVNEYFIVELQVGTKLDCKDEYGMWFIGQVMEIKEDEKAPRKVYIHYCGWRTVFDEWIEMQSVCWRFDLLNVHTPVDEDLIIVSAYTDRHTNTPFYRECPTASQRQTLVRRISEMGLPPDAVAQEYEQFGWIRSPFVIFRDLCCEFPKRFVCRCAPKKPICSFCSNLLLR